MRCIVFNACLFAFVFGLLATLFHVRDIKNGVVPHYAAQAGAR